MNKTTVLVLLLAVVLFISCKNSSAEIDKIEITKKYFETLNNPRYFEAADWFSDSLVTIEGVYKQIYSKNEFLEFLEWDAIFNPNYKILDIKLTNDVVVAKISKMDERISFLHEKPFLTHQIIEFQNEKIISVETKYLNFNEAVWQRNKTGLLTWIDKNNPNLNGFIHDLTEAGGIKFLRAIELYKNNN